MAKPRRPFGTTQPGRLQATMLKVLAAEMSDAGRLSRGKRYHQDDAVIDITIGRGVATAEVQGSRETPYVVTVEAEPGDGVPRRNEIWLSCTCPDDTGTGRDACKHAVAALLCLATEISIEPELLERWRAGRRTGNTAHTPQHDDAYDDEHDSIDDTDDADSNVFDIASGRRLVEAARSERQRRAEFDRNPGERTEQTSAAIPKDDDQISAMLRAPDGGGVPSFDAAEPIEHPNTGDAQLDDVIDDVLRHLRIRWD